MGTKNHPGKFDCYDAAEPDEPMFVLLGRDRHAAALVRIWALLRRNEDEDDAVVKEALDCAEAMAEWCLDRGKTWMGSEEAVCLLLAVLLGDAAATREALKDGTLVKRANLTSAGSA